MNFNRRACFEGRLDSLFLESILFLVPNLKYSHIVLLLPSFKLFDGTASKMTIWILFLLSRIRLMVEYSCIPRRSSLRNV